MDESDRAVTFEVNSDLHVVWCVEHNNEVVFVALVYVDILKRQTLLQDQLKEFLDTIPGIGAVYAIGPLPMMKAVANLTRPYHVHTLVSLNTVMVDGTGMCGGCRVTVNGEMKFACVDGPEFDGHTVDFDELMMRNRTYNEMERISEEEHACRLAAITQESVR